MPCIITVYKQEDGKVYIGTMNSSLMGKVFGSKVVAIMGRGAADQKVFIPFDATDQDRAPRRGRKPLATRAPAISPLKAMITAWEEID